jgi:hypothetical protein
VTTTLALASILVTKLSGAYDWRVVRDGPSEFNRYYRRPSRHFRVRLVPRDSV